MGQGKNKVKLSESEQKDRTKTKCLFLSGESSHSSTPMFTPATALLHTISPHYVPAAVSAFPSPPSTPLPPPAMSSGRGRPTEATPPCLVWSVKPKRKAEDKAASY